MIYSKECLIKAIQFVIPELKNLPSDQEFPFDTWVDILSIVSAQYFILDEDKDLTPSQKYAFVIIQHAARELDKSRKIEFGDQNVEFVGEPLVP